MKRKLGMLAGLVTMTFAAMVGQAGAVSISTYCDGTCYPSGQHVVYRCGYGVGAPSCCHSAWLNACPSGEEFSGICRDSAASLYC